MKNGYSRVDRLNASSWESVFKSPREALETAEEALALAEKTGYSKGEASARLNIGWAFVTRGDYQAALESFQKSHGIFVELEDRGGQMLSLNALGAACQSLCRYDMAMDHYAASIELARSERDPVREASALNNISELCIDLGNFKEALDYLLKAYDLVPDKGFEELAATILMNSGRAFLRTGNLPVAREFAERALAISDRAGIRVVSARCWLLLGRIAHGSGRADLALAYARKSLDGAHALGDRLLAVEALLETGSIRAARGEPESALSDYSEALDLAVSIGSKVSRRDAYERMADAWEIAGDTRAALDCFRRFHALERELASEDTTRKLKDLQVRYELERARSESELFRLRNVELRDKTEMLENANSRLLTISDLGRKITSSLDLERMVHSVYESLSTIVDTTTFAIGVFDPETEEVDFRYAIERGNRLDAPTARGSGSFAIRAVRSRSPVYVDDMAREIEAGAEVESAGEHALSLAYIPLAVEDRIIGVMTVQSFETRAYDDGRKALLEMLAPYVAIALENCLIHDRVEDLNRIVSSEKRRLEDAAAQIEHLANHDALTGLPNRRLLFELARHMLDSSARENRVVGVLYLDLDDFKPINDRFGHVVGDRALVSIANRLKMMLRSSDTIARIGGDEFVAIVNNVHGRADIEKVAKKIISECRAPLDTVPGGYRVSVSMGIALFPSDSSSIDELIVMADSAMYSVKHARKNSFAFHSDVAAPPSGQP